MLNFFYYLCHPARRLLHQICTLLQFQYFKVWKYFSMPGRQVLEVRLQWVSRPFGDTLVQGKNVFALVSLTSVWNKSAVGSQMQRVTHCRTRYYRVMEERTTTLVLFSPTGHASTWQYFYPLKDEKQLPSIKVHFQTSIKQGSSHAIIPCTSRNQLKISRLCSRQATHGRFEQVCLEK